MFRFVGDTARFRAWVNGHGVWSRLSFLGMMMFQIIVAFIPGEPLEICKFRPHSHIYTDF